MKRVNSLEFFYITDLFAHFLLLFLLTFLVFLLFTGLELFGYLFGVFTVEGHELELVSKGGFVDSEVLLL